MRLIDVDMLKADYGMKDDCSDCERESKGTVKACEYDYVYRKMDFCGWLDDAPTAEGYGDLVSEIVEVYRHNNGDMEYSGHYVETLLKKYRLIGKDK